MYPELRQARAPVYNGFGRRRQRYSACLVLVCLMLGACSVSMPMASLLSPKTAEKPLAADDTLVTGSISPATAESDTITLPLPKAEWQSAKKAMDEALSQPSESATVPWDHADSHMRGSITAMQRSKGANGVICRNFLGSAYSDKGESWFEGRACRAPNGSWEMQDLRPWKKS